MSEIKEHVPTSDRSRIAADWENLLDELRALGGVAENIVLGYGALGRGLFPRDPTKPYLLRLPDNLLFPVEDVEFVEGRIRVREGAAVGVAERNFFERYQSGFSWGGGGESESANLIAMYDSLPAEVRAMLIDRFAMADVLKGDRVERARMRFLHSRVIHWNDKTVVMPLIELANCDSQADGYAADEQGRLQIAGTTDGEIVVNYGPHDSLGIFNTFGFASARPWAYSVPVETKVGTMKLVIGWNTANKTGRGQFMTPKMTIENKTISLSYLMIGNANFPRLSRGTFCALMREAEAIGADDAFDIVLRANKQAFLDLLEALEPHRGEMIVMLRRVAHFQLEAMTHCVGTREL